MEMTNAAREAQNAYKRAWNKRNPDKNKEYQRRYWARKAKEIELSRQETEGNERQEIHNGIDSETG